ncbi:hypothetical protein SQ54_17490 [Klebsiella pneumoniae]|nr:hypothetical protein SQ54_17490 [Klebsiella pneumoniae]
MTAPVAVPTTGTTEPIAAPVPAPLSAPATPPAIPPAFLPIFRSLTRSEPHCGHILVICYSLDFWVVKKQKGTRTLMNGCLFNLMYSFTYEAFSESR